MKPRTLRRKLQKKIKRKPYRRCPECGKWTTVKLTEIEGRPRIFKVCGIDVDIQPAGNLVVRMGVAGCGYLEELYRGGLRNG